MAVGFVMFRFLFFLVFFIILGSFAVMAIRGLSQWNWNNQQPVLKVLATVVAKRADMTYHQNGRRTTYHITFEVESGDRIEFCVNGKEYGMLVEQDFGTLTFQGKRYLGFERD